MDTEYVPVLLVTANVGSVFEDVSGFFLYIIRRLKKFVRKHQAMMFINV